MEWYCCASQVNTRGGEQRKEVQAERADGGNVAGIASRTENAVLGFGWNTDVQAL